mgnify:CR=1 FL=1
MPGVSMIQERGLAELSPKLLNSSTPKPPKGYISLNVVVCIPLWCADEMAPVRAISLPKMAFNNVDLPTPELPEKLKVEKRNFFWR